MLSDHVIPAYLRSLESALAELHQRSGMEVPAAAVGADGQPSSPLRGAGEVADVVTTTPPQQQWRGEGPAVGSSGSPAAAAAALALRSAAVRATFGSSAAAAAAGKED